MDRKAQPLILFCALIAAIKKDFTISIFTTKLKNGEVMNEIISVKYMTNVLNMGCVRIVAKKSPIITHTKCVLHAGINSGNTQRNIGVKNGVLSLQEREYIGVCRYCDNPVVEGRSFCEKHLEQARKSAQIATKKRLASLEWKNKKEELFAWTFLRRYDNGN